MVNAGWGLIAGFADLTPPRNYAVQITPGLDAWLLCVLNFDSVDGLYWVHDASVYSLDFLLPYLEPD